MAKYSKNHNTNNHHGRDTHPRDDRRNSATENPTYKGKNAWNPLAKRYSGMVGSEGSKYHQTLAFPHTLKMLGIKDGDKILDIGCGTGVFSKYVADAGGIYYGLDISKGMIAEAKAECSKFGKFFVLDILRIRYEGEFKPESFDAITFILSIQDMSELSTVITNASKLLRKGGKLVMFIKHPSFNIPRQSGWIEDKERSLTSRRVDRYLTPLDMPLMNKFGKKTVTTFHYHHALQDYMKAFLDNKLSVFAFEEVADVILKDKKTAEFPLFLAIGAKKI
jgi:ubiquinone/menaquinone biosynthesis C-methylase UbiE